MNKVIIAPSLLAADFRNLEREFEKINSSNAEWIHFDVMDGINVPNISFGFPLLEATRRLTDKYIDVHLMIEKPSKYFKEFKKHGADGLTIHYENQVDIKHQLLEIKALGMNAGLVLNPDTDVAIIEEYLAEVDLILLMSVFPGFGGQKFIEATYDRVRLARELITKSNKKVILQVDGGVSAENSRRLIAEGANALVCGSALFKQNDFCGYVDKMRAS
jgi:ribulose-phosphate 3-epimerase